MGIKDSLYLGKEGKRKQIERWLGKNNIHSYTLRPINELPFWTIDVDGADAHTYVTQTFPEGYTIDATTGFVDVTFFLFPDVEFNVGNNTLHPDSVPAKDLKLKVLYQVDGVQQSKTATLIKEIQPKKKYFFSNVKLPAIKNEESVSASNWFNALDDKILFNQVSIPVASNVFANPLYAKTNVNDYTTQQTSYLKDLWNMGVRGFELCNQSATDTNEGTETVQAKNLDAEGMVASEKVLDFTFRQAIDTLYQCFIKSNSKEPLILICTYAAVNDGYNPYHYVANLFNSLNSFCTRNTVDRSTFVQITSTTTTKDLKGKIAVVIRPGDDERWMYQTTVHNFNRVINYESDVTTDPYKMLGGIELDTTYNSPYALTKSIRFAQKCVEEETYRAGTLNYPTRDIEVKASLFDNAWWNQVLMVSDWGISSWDSWHRRGGTYYQYATTATNYDEIDKISDRPLLSKGKYEDLILAGTATSLKGYYYKHDMSNGATAFIQDMTRVMPTSITTTQNSKTYTWPESKNEKKTAIDGLFQLSVDTKGDVDSKDLYVNVLSSYYGITGHPVSLYPCYDGQGFKNAGKGGDYKSAAKEMTTHTYNLLSGASTITGTETKLSEGPWGLVMMDYIGDGEVNPDSRKLVNLIMLNNFKFPLAKTQGTGTETGGEGTTD